MLALLAMAWDGQWFLKVCDAHGWEEATRLNAQVRASFGRIEMRRMLRALGKRQADDLGDAARILYTYFQEVLAAGFDADFVMADSRLEVTVTRCAALWGAKRAGLERRDQACIACRGLWRAYFEVLLPDRPIQIEMREQMGCGAGRCHFVVISSFKKGEFTMSKDKEQGTIFSAEGVRKLLEKHGGESLNDDERALLLALVETDAATGRSLSEKEKVALEKLKSQVEDYNASDLAQAIVHMVTSEPKENRKMDWPDVRRGRREDGE